MKYDIIETFLGMLESPQVVEGHAFTRNGSLVWSVSSTDAMRFGITRAGAWREHEHKAISARFIPHGAPSGYRRTGVEQQETCACGATRHVWITTFKVEAGAWDTEGKTS